MKIGDLVKYKDRYKETVGIIVNIKDEIRHQVGAYPQSYTFAVVSWTTSDGNASISMEDVCELEVVNESW
mgnify:CR=1 FL=1|tara:strand:+ start:260 stop:469 length:210 start_codon:yes stop_codon:yes gene_type:complete